MEPPDVGQSFGAFQLCQLLGSGGMGEVWRAIDTRLARAVALKLLSPARIRDGESRARFFQEVRACSALNHPNIVTVFEAGEQDGRPFLVMEMIEGETLRKVLERGPVEPERALDITRQVLLGLAEAHAVGILHRDIKPENVMLRTDGYVKVVDFGLAQIMRDSVDTRITATDAVVGTPMYMSPEQASGVLLDARSDVFSLGIVLYEMLSGRRPFQGASFLQILNAMAQSRPAVIPGLSPELRRFLDRSLEREREDRYRDAQEMLLALREVTGSSGHVPVRMPSRAGDVAIVALPLSAPVEDQDLADGIVDEIILQLEKLKDLRVISRTTAERFRGRESDARAVGRELNVGHALEGTLRRSGRRVRVTLGLTETREGFRVWGDRFDAQDPDPFDLQEEIATAVVSAVRAKLCRQASVVAEAPHESRDSLAARLYQQGVQKLRTLNADNLKEALTSLEQSVKLRPDYAVARARLAEALQYAGSWLDSVVDGARYSQRALEEATTALELDPGIPEACFAMGLIEMSEWRSNFVAARHYLRKAVDMQPNHAPALCWLSLVSTTLGNCAEGEALARRSLQLDPFNAISYVWLSYAVVSQGRIAEATDAGERALRLEPSNPMTLGALLFYDLMQDFHDNAVRMRNHFHEGQIYHPVLRAGLALIEVCVDGKSYRALDVKTRDSIERTVTSLRIAADLPAQDGDVATTVSLLRRAFARGYRNVSFIEKDPLLGRVRETPEMRALCQEMREAIRADREF